MNMIFYQMLHSLKRVFTDVKPLLSKFATIAVVILILGSAFSDNFSSVSDSIDPVKLGYVNQDKGEFGKQMIDTLKNTENIKNWIILTEVNSLEEGKKLTGQTEKDKNMLEGIIYFPENFTEKFKDKDKEAIIKIFTGKTSQVNSIVIKSVFSAFTNVVDLNKVVLEEFQTGLTQEFETDEGVKTLPISAKNEQSAMDYYAIAMLMMFLIFSAEYGCDAIAEDFLGNIGERIKTTPLRAYQQYIGKMAGLCIASTIQGIFLVIFTKILYNVNWGDNYPILLLIIFSMSCAAISIGALLCMITRNKANGRSLVSLLIIASTFLAGGFVVLDLGIVKYISPNYHGHTAITSMIYKADISSIYINIATLWAFTIISSALTVILSRRKKS